MKIIAKFIRLGNKQLPLNLARRNKLEFNIDENDYENMEPKTHEEEKEVTVISLSATYIYFDETFIIVELYFPGGWLLHSCWKRPYH